ncbi:MAG: PEP-CTERM sorting domain-containing protein [Planctomycetes bacterium]|nr:PEP-CTERM sorting domain-containing protein [Planctomycetota bacterium]
MDNRSNEYISEALKIADDLIDFANDQAGLEDEGGCSILFAVCRDCAYRIRRHAKHEGRKVKLAWVQANVLLVIFAVALLSIVSASPVSATTIILSTNTGQTLGGLTFGKDALAEYNPTTDLATLFLDGSLLTGTGTNIDSVHILDSGNIILSTAGAATLGGLSFGKNDLIEYNPTTDTSTLYFDGTSFSGNADIDAAYINGSANIILSTTGNATLGGLTFTGVDLVEYNPATDTATLFLDGILLTGNGTNIDATHILESGNIILSTAGAATLGGLSFGGGDLAEYNPTTDTATLYFDESNFAGNANVGAVSITSMPEPATVALLGLGCVVLIGGRKCK